MNEIFFGNSNIVEDNLGFIRVFGTEGLGKYDGYSFSLTPYKSLFGAEYVRDRDFLMNKDGNNNIWISSFNGELTKIGANGVNTSYKKEILYNKAPQQISAMKAYAKDMWFGSINGILYKHDFINSKIDSIAALPSLNDLPQRVGSIAITNFKEIWISTFRGKVYSYSLTTNTFKALKLPIKDKTQTIKIVNDKNGELWIATELDGLFRYSPKQNNNSFKQYNNLDSSKTGQKHHMYISVFCDKSGKIWAGTDGDGLYSINPVNDKITTYKHEETNKFSISNNTIININEDSKGNIWVLAKKGEINILPNNNNNIKYYNGLENNTPTNVLSILKSSDNSLWLGTDGKGLNRVFPNNTKVQYDINKKGEYFFEGRYVQSLVEDAKGNIWIGTYQKGLWVYNKDSRYFTKVNTSNSSGIYASDIRALFKDSKNRIWVASSNSINVFSDNQEQVANFDYDDNGLFGSISMAINEDENGTIWAGINPNKLFKFNENFNDINKSYFTKHNYFLKQKNDSRNYNIHSLLPDYKGNLWILCASGMLQKFKLKDNTYESLANKNHFKNIVLNSILFEDSNNLWISSNNGVHHYNIEDDTFKSFYRIDGFQSNSFTRRSAFKDSEGILYFGSEDGVNSFLPSQLNKEEVKAKLYINNIEILNKPARSIIGDQIKGGIEYIQELNLNSNQSSFSFQFSAIDNVINPNYHYAYKLNGFDADWIIPKNDRIATYTNIPYGDYIFEVKAGSKKGEWNIAPIQVAINIKPPWWHSNMAYIVYFIASLLLIYGITIWVRLKNKLAKEAWQNNKEKELYAMKMNFFAKMSHEIQTPLTLILGPIEDMLERASANKNQLLKQRLQIISNNANRLSRIAMELMTVRNKELGKLRVFASNNNLIDHLKHIALSFSEQARFKNIDFVQEYPNKPVNIWYDRDKIEHVIYNLLSNAFKFTPKEGEISLKTVCNTDDDFVEISVTDSGPGIPETELEDIFKLFYQTDIGKHKKGIGIGLALTKELVSLHKGEINVESSSELGTCFSIKLSTKDDIFSEDEKVFIHNTKPISDTLASNFNSLEKEFGLKVDKKEKHTHTLLIVEDNIEMQIFLRDVLSDTYNLLIAENGKVGLKLAEKHTPDLIISDIMMPVMDGIEMSKKLHKKKSTMHIPVILLTAKNSTPTRLAGLKSGAIEYIVKPFNFQELSLKIKNIIESKEKVLSKYKIDRLSNPSQIEELSKDDIFIKDLVEELKKQIENPDFKLEELSNSLNMSYSVIYRKCQDITGKTIVELVRSLKIKKAALLIIQKGYNISEASYMVGYKDSKYFTKCFKEEFGIPPTNFKREAKDLGVFEVIKKYKIQY
ncbi:response regulator [Sabulilitoribacter arenilitoris]|uniref:histidine kinase n=1 Tax=Wocania arenilitoris TaxID=2044858 RepID=A0AAE3EMJ7_9FLAO|nr:two-component regulator propeller domain-containing protein [Wocania arenilitoris]MCF7567642.1 response regulator [Wocania arenilitoris]